MASAGHLVSVDDFARLVRRNPGELQQAPISTTGVGTTVVVPGVAARRIWVDLVQITTNGPMQGAFASDVTLITGAYYLAGNFPHNFQWLWTLADGEPFTFIQTGGPQDVIGRVVFRYL